MRYVTVRLDTPAGPVDRAGVLDAEGGVLDLNRAFRAALVAQETTGRADEIAHALVPPSMLGIVQGGARTQDAIAESLAFAAGSDGDHHGLPLIYPLGSYRLRAPLPRPNSLRDFLLFEDHFVNSKRGQKPPDVWYEMPIYYKGNPDSVVGPGDEIPWPVYTDKLDYELEIGSVIGRKGRAIAADDAHGHIFGFTIFNDWSARDIQRREMALTLGPGLGKDFANGLGPCIVTPDEFDPVGARMVGRVNGEVWSSGVVGDMQFDFPTVISWISMEQELHPGDVLGSGTVGTGAPGSELDRWLAPGDVVELEVDGIGVLANRIGLRSVSPIPSPPAGRVRPGATE